MNTLEQRISWVVDGQDRSIADIARKAKVTEQAIHDWKHGRRRASKIGRGATSDALERVARELGVDPVWLRTGEGRAPIGWDEPVVVASAYATATQRAALRRRFGGSLDPMQAMYYVGIVDNLVARQEADLRQVGDDDPAAKAENTYLPLLLLRDQILRQAGGRDKLAAAARKYQEAWYAASKKAAKAGALDPDQWEGPSMAMRELDDEGDEPQAYPALPPE